MTAFATELASIFVTVCGPGYGVAMLVTACSYSGHRSRLKTYYPSDPCR